MKAKYLNIKGLYGYLNKEINFNKDITILVGINGSGKTSILNIINWLLKPNIAYLCATPFEQIEFIFEYKSVEYTICVRHIDKMLNYQLTSGNNEKFSPLLVHDVKPPIGIVDELDKKSIIESTYAPLKPEKRETKTWDFIRSLPRPTVIGLDRQLFTEESDNVYVDDIRKIKSDKRTYRQQDTPLDRVKFFVNTEYRKRKNDIYVLTEKLKNHLMFYAFEGNLNIEQIAKAPTKIMTLKEIELAHTKVKKYFKNFESKIFSASDEEKIGSYFSNMKLITANYSKSKPSDINRLIYQLNALQFSKIEDLLLEFQKFDSQYAEIMSLIDKFLEITNIFFSDSYKYLIFKPDTLELCFNIINKNRDMIFEYKDISFLSSGEQQILILFAYIAFISKEGGLFIIDEPELSLHIKWQEIFVENFEKLIPNGIQVLIATHSPIIVGKKKENAVLLFPFSK